MVMQIKVTADGVLIPKDWLGDSDRVEIRREGDRIAVIPLVEQSPSTLADIRAAILPLKSVLQTRYRVTTLGIFGSYARHEQREDSDVDVLIDYIQPPSLIKVVELRDFLSETLERKVDVVTVNGLRADIKDQVLADVIYLWNGED
jgi:uncharacterized protein